MFTSATSRKGRHNTNGQPSINLVTMNPNNTFLKEMFYRPYRENRLPPGIVVIEFTLEDSWQTDEEIELMRTNPRPWVERYLNNNWDYIDDDNSLFSYAFFDASITNELDLNKHRYMGVDVAREGKDRSVVALWYEKTLVDIKVIKDATEKKTTDEQALEVIKHMTRQSVIASNVSIDGVGVGVGVIDHMHSKGIEVTTFKSGASATMDTYDNLRSQVIWEFSQGLEKGQIKIYSGCPYRNELISEAMMHLKKIDDKKLIVESKDKVKKRTGSMSPDIFDAVVMGLYPQLKLEPISDQDRIVF